MNRLLLGMYLGKKKHNVNTTWLDRLICFATNSIYSHAELIYEYDDLSTRGISWSCSPRDKGIRKLDLNYNSGHWHVYEFFTTKNSQYVDEWFSQRQHIRYDYLGALGVVVPFVKQQNSRLFCFEAIAMCLGWSDASKLDADELLTRAPMLKRIL